MILSGQLLTVAFFLSFEIVLNSRVCYAKCLSPQYAEIGKKGTVECTFPSTFKGVIWYDSKNTSMSPVVRIERQDDDSFQISGDGFDAGNYDVNVNGSLVISNVTTQSERIFTVLLVDELYSAYVFTVKVISVVFPDQTAPVVYSCGDANPCLIKSMGNETIICIYRHARPAVNLSLFVLNEGEFEVVTAEKNIYSDDNVTFTSSLSYNASYIRESLLNILVCRGFGPAIKFSSVETYILVQKLGEKKHKKEDTEFPRRTVSLHSGIDIPCTEKDIPSAFVWEKFQSNHSQVIVYSANGKERFVSTLKVTPVVSKDGTLQFRKVTTSVEGVYTCTFLVGGISSSSTVEIEVQGNDGKFQGESPAAVLKWNLVTVIIVVCVTALTVLIGCLSVLAVFLCLRRSNESFEEADDKSETHPLQPVNITTPIDLCKEFAENLLAWPFIFENDPCIFHENAINLLRDVSKELDEARREKDRAEAAGAAVGIGAGVVTLAGVVVSVLTGGGALLFGAGAVLGVGGAAIGVCASLEKLKKDKKQIKMVQPSYESFINIQKWLSKIIINIATAHEIINFFREKQFNMSRNINVKEVESILEDMRVAQKWKDVTVQNKIKDIMEYSKKLANILLRVLEPYPTNTASNLPEWKRNFKKEEGFKSDVVSEAVVNLSQNCQSEHKTFTFLVFVQSLYATDFQSVDGICAATQEGKIDVGKVTAATVQAMVRSNLADDAARIGLNATRLARGVAVAGVFLNIVGMGMDAAALEKTLSDIESDEREELSQCLADTADVMEEMNSLVKNGKVQ